jgi:hypothetical protein
MRFGAITPGARLGGVAINIPPHTSSNLSALNIYLMADAYRASSRVLDRPSRERDAILFKIYGSRSIESLLRNGTPPARIVAGWDGSVSRFRGERGPYLLYP